jgi:hypothetical protein
MLDHSLPEVRSAGIRILSEFTENTQVMDTLGRIFESETEIYEVRSAAFNGILRKEPLNALTLFTLSLPRSRDPPVYATDAMAITRVGYDTADVVRRILTGTYSDAVKKQSIDAIRTFIATVQEFTPVDLNKQRHDRREWRW